MVGRPLREALKDAKTGLLREGAQIVQIMYVMVHVIR